MISSKRGNWGLLTLLVFNFFLIIVAIMVVFTTLGFISVERGLLSQDFWTDPILLTLIVLFVSVVLTSAVSFIVKQLVVEPLRDMLHAMGELKRGNFEVRVKNGRSFKIREVDEFADGFNATAEALGQIEILRHDFINDFSHEFKTPIVSINGFAELLRESDLTNDERKEYAEVIAAESRRLVRLSSDILMLRQAESLGYLRESDVGEVCIDEQLRSSVLILQGTWLEKNLNFEVNLDSAAVQGNAGFLHQAWMNLLDNACKFSREGGFVRVFATERGGQVTVSVENEGAVIAPEQLGRVFERFYQADPSHATQGCGLGLPLVKCVVELHRGTVFVTSENGRTVFTVKLPSENVR